MMAIADLYNLLEKAKTVHEEAFDTRFENVVALVDQEKLDEASTIIESIFNEGTIDIRLVMYYFYAQFITQGIVSFKEMFPAITAIINDHWEKISPADLRDKHLATSLAWLLSTIGRKLKRVEKLLKDKKPDEFWNSSVKALEGQDIQLYLELTHNFGKFLMQKLEEPTLYQHIMFINKWLDGLKNINHEPKIIEKTSPATPQEPEKETPKPQPPPVHEILIETPPMLNLVQKIQAFESVIAKKDFEKAALISDDIAHTIKNFDPTHFFPKLFSHYFSLSAEHMDALSEEWEKKGSLKWDALSKLYQTDLEEFIQW